MIRRGDAVDIEPQIVEHEPDDIEDGEAFHATPLARPWPRYWARQFDITAGVFGLAFIIGLLRPSWFSDDGNDGLVFIALLPPTLLLEALILVVFGNTLGKAIAGIRVETLAHQRMGIVAAVVRNVRIWIFGLAFGIPLICIATFSANFRKVKEGVQTSWDSKGETRVFGADSTPTRTWVTALLFISLIALGAFLKGAVPTGEQKYANALPELNQGLPKKIDDVTRLDHIGVEGKSLVYNYTLTNTDGSIMSAETGRKVAQNVDMLKTQAKKAACSERTTNAFSEGMSMQYNYYAGGEAVINFAIFSSDC